MLYWWPGLATYPESSHLRLGVRCFALPGLEYRPRALPPERGRGMKGYRKGEKHGTRTHVHVPGERFGHLEILAESEERKQGGVCWICRCDCGRKVTILGSKMRIGDQKSCGCMNPAHERGSKSPRWQGGRYIAATGYAYINRPEHPNTNTRGYILEHIFVMSETLGRPLRKGESVHHKNGLKADNRPENLELFCRQHLPGQRVSDMVDFCIEYLKQYAPDRLA